jgi:hypothetical protein
VTLPRPGRYAVLLLTKRPDGSFVGGGTENTGTSNTATAPNWSPRDVHHAESMDQGGARLRRVSGVG